MITAGIDIGLEYAKAVVQRDGRILGRGRGPSGGALRAAAAEEVLRAAVREAGIDRETLGAVGVTGKGKHNTASAGYIVTEPRALAAAGRELCPGARLIVGTGADETVAVALGQDGAISEFTLNQKCSAGLGMFLEHLAQRLELPQDIPEGSVVLNEGCVVFAELDALSLLNRGAAPEAVMGAAVGAVAVRISSVIHDITVREDGPAVLFGGLASNAALVAALERQSGIRFAVPEEAVYAGALGAALCAREAAEEVTP